MAPMRAPRLVCVLGCLPAAALLVSGCGGDSSSTASIASSPATAPSLPAPPKSDFPSAKGKTLREVLKVADSPSELIVAPAAMVFYKGRNRYPFGIFERDRTQVPDAEVALYFARVPTPGKGAKPKKALDQPAVGPFPASVESLATKPAFRAKTTADDPDAASVVYSTEVDFPGNGEWLIAALVREGDEIKAKVLPSAVVGEFSKIPRAGQPAPKIHTPTAADVGGDLAKITTRIPPDTQNKVDYADVLGKEPIMLLFATPQFCQSRVCGPVVDVAQQLQHEDGNKAAFIHMEIYNENDPSKHARPQVRAFDLPSEPWLFAINDKGVVSSAIEGAIGVERMTAALDKAVAE
jgi:hypothetical protein